MDQDATPAAKKGKMENGDSYIPTQSEKNGDGTSNLSLIFSLQEQQGELVKSLNPFQVRGDTVHVV
jgi:prephenate dehydratase